MTERRVHPQRHRAILRFAAGLAVSATLVASGVPALAESSLNATPTPRSRDERPADRVAERHGQEHPDESGRRSRDGGTATPVVAANGRSVRPRGEAAPVRLGPTATTAATLLLPTSTPTPGMREPGQAPLNQPLGSERRYAIPKKPEADTGVRVWPMRESDYSFSQEYGCVQQISGFYPAADGCPPDRPVVHSGLDFAADTGTPIYAAASGWVTEAGLDRETGLANTRLVIQHEGKNRDYATEYLHWISTSVKPGDYVRAGEQIAEVGSVGYSTGPHLHFAVIDFETGEYLDPRSWLPGNTADGDYREARRERPRTRFADRSAGVPDYHDPSPAPAPTRQPVPEGGRAEGSSGASAGPSREDRKRERRQRRAERRDRMRAAASTSSAAEATAAPERPERERRVRPDRTRDDASAKESRDAREKGRDRDRRSDDGGNDRPGKRDDERGDGNGDGRGQDRGRTSQKQETAEVAAVPDASITGGLPSADAPASEPAAAATPASADPDRAVRPGRAR